MFLNDSSVAVVSDDISVAFLQFWPIFHKNFLTLYTWELVSTTTSWVPAREAFQRHLASLYGIFYLTLTALMKNRLEDWHSRSAIHRYKVFSRWTWLLLS